MRAEHFDFLDWTASPNFKVIDPDSLASRNSLAKSWAEKTPDEISLAVSYMTLNEHRGFISELLARLDVSIEGVGAELGAGASVLSNSLCKIFPKIKKIYAVELVPEMAILLQPKIIKANQNVGRVLPVVGSFDELKLLKSSLDFVVAFDSLHHSNDMKKTLVEANRVLRSGGTLIAFDRAQPNNLSEAQREFMLNVEYSEEFKLIHNLPVNIKFTRRENGEHEPRLNEWVKNFKDAGFAITSMTAFTKKNKTQFGRMVAALVPFRLRLLLGRYQSLVAHPKIMLYYLFPLVGVVGRLKIRSFDSNFSNKSAPGGKFVIVAKKL